MANKLFMNVEEVAQTLEISKSFAYKIVEKLNEELIASKLHADFPEAWAPTDQWDKEWANDRRWS